MNIANAHLHCAIASTTNTVSNKEIDYNDTFDRWANNLMKFNCRFLCGDFSMAAIEVIAQLRARGFCANLVSWHPWVKLDVPGRTELIGDNNLMIDSILIIAIGPIEGIRLPFGYNVFNNEDHGWKCDTIRCQRTRPECKHKLKLEEYNVKRIWTEGPGHSIVAYRPSNPHHKRWCIILMFRPMLGTKDTEEADCRHWQAMRVALFHIGGLYCPSFDMDSDMGAKTWDLPILPLCKSKPIPDSKCDELEQFLAHGGHMPIITWIGGNVHDTRSQEASLIRTVKRKAKVTMWQNTPCQYTYGMSMGETTYIPIITAPPPGLVQTGLVQYQ